MTAKKKSIPVAGAVGNPPTLEQTLPVKTALPVSEQKILPKSVSTATEELEKAPPHSSSSGIVPKEAEKLTSLRDKMSPSEVTEPKAVVKDRSAPAEPKQPTKTRDATRSEKPEQLEYISLSEPHPFKKTSLWCPQ